jgi:hypothetical protein
VENGGLKRHQIAWVWSCAHVPAFEMSRNLKMLSEIIRAIRERMERTETNPA